MVQGRVEGLLLKRSIPQFPSVKASILAAKHFQMFSLDYHGETDRPEIKCLQNQGQLQKKIFSGTEWDGRGSSLSVKLSKPEPSSI